MATEFDELERGIESSQPYELYWFQVGNAVSFRYCRDRNDITYNENVYTAANIRQEGFEGGSDPNKAQISVFCDIGLEISQLIINGPPSEVIFLSVFRGQRETGIVNLQWSGEVLGNGATEEGTTLTAADATQSQMRNGLMERWQRTCGFGIYEPFTCKAEKTFRQVGIPLGVARTQSSFTSPLLTPALLIPAGKMVAGHEVNWFTGGYVEYEDDITGIGCKRVIIGYDPDTGRIDLHPNMNGYAAGSYVTVYPGCFHNTLDCDIKHNNLPNCGCSPFIPDKNIFEPGEIPW